MAAAFAVGLALAGCAGGPAPDGAGAGATTAEVRIAAAADLKFALEEVVALLQERHPELRITTTYGSSGTFLSQISNGAPFDVFLSADLTYPRQLVEEGLADEEDLFPYAVGRLVLWAGDEGGLDPADIGDYASEHQLSGPLRRRS